MAGDQPTHHLAGDAADLGIEGLSEISVVGTGGSSTVYRARQKALDRIVAVKVLHGAWSMETRERFDRERQVMGRLSGHSAVVPIFQTGVTTRGEPFLILPFYPKGSLFRLMKDRGPLPWREAAFIVDALAEAVADCHRFGIVHRDVKPGNILLTDHLQPRLTDFGITKPTGEPTTGSAVAYTPSYSPPEAFGGGTAETTTDVYGLGATLWALLAGRAPFTEPGERSETSDVLDRAANDELLAPAADTPPPLVALLQRAMAKDPAARPGDAGEFLAELRRAVRLSEDHQTVEQVAADARPVPFPTWVLIALMIAGLALIAGTAVALTLVG